MTLLEANCLLEELIIKAVADHLNSIAKVIHSNHLWLTQDSDGNWAFNDDNHAPNCYDNYGEYEDRSTFTEEFLRIEAANWIECITTNATPWWMSDG
jgi:hypothetical protein